MAPLLDGGPVGGGNQFTGASSTLIEYVGDFAYAYSGAIGIDDTETTMLEAKNGTKMIIAKFQFGNLLQTGLDYHFAIYLNDAVIQAVVFNQANVTPMIPIELIIPAYTIIKVTGDNRESGASKDWSLSMVGRTYR